MKWLGHEIDENGIKPNKDKVKAILDLKHPESQKELKSFLRAIQYLAKFLPRLSERTDRLRKLLKKNTEWKWATEQENDFLMIKKMLTEEPALAYYAKDKENIVTTDASKTGLGKTLFQKQSNCELKPIAFGSRFLNDTEKKIFDRRIRTTSGSLGPREISILPLREESIFIYRPPSARTAY